MFDVSWSVQTRMGVVHKSRTFPTIEEATAFRKIEFPALGFTTLRELPEPTGPVTPEEHINSLMSLGKSIDG